MPDSVLTTSHYHWTWCWTVLCIPLTTSEPDARLYRDCVPSSVNMMLDWVVNFPTICEHDAGPRHGCLSLPMNLMPDCVVTASHHLWIWCLTESWLPPDIREHDAGPCHGCLSPPVNLMPDIVVTSSNHQWIWCSTMSWMSLTTSEPDGLLCPDCLPPSVNKMLGRVMDDSHHQ